MKNQSFLAKKHSRLSLAIALASSSLLATYVHAIPQQGDFDAVNGGSQYNQTGGQGDLTVSQNGRVVQFGGAGVNVANGETFSVNHNGGSSDWSVLIRDVNTNGNASFIDGTLNGNVRVFLVNQNGLVFGQNAQVNLASLVASTANLSNTDFENGDYNFTDASDNGRIVIEGLRSNVAGAQIAFISREIIVDGAVDLTGGDLNLVAGERVTLTFAGDNLMQFDITEALQGAANPAIQIAGNGDVNAVNVNLRALLSDPRSLAINNEGIIRASGIDTSTPGVVRLIGSGGKIESSGSIDVSADNGIANGGDGSIEMSAASVEIGGVVDAGSGQLDVVIGDGSQFGSFRVIEQTALTLGGLAIEGLGVVNTVSGLGNYQVSGLNSGTASYTGVGSNTWTNNGDITFNNVSRLFATSAIANTFEVLDGAALNQAFSSMNFGSITGGSQSDTFIIGGTIQTADGGAGNDFFEMNGGFVAGEINGGSNDGDTIRNVFNPQDLGGGAGASDFVTSWVSIEVVEEFQVPPVDPDPIIPPVIDPVPFIDPTSAILVPNNPSLAIVDSSGASLGLVGDDNLRLPCGHNNTRDLLTAEEHSAKEEDCFNKYGGPEYQKLISSIIHFDNDSHAITTASADRLNRVSTFVVESDMFERVVLSGHTDINASESYNMRLSSQRASAAGDHMQSQGVSSDMIETHAFGESLPAKSNDSEANRAFNRRVHVDLKK